MQIELPHSFTRFQQDFILSDARHTCLSAGVGAGKSLGLIYRALSRSIKKPGSVSLLGMHTYPQLRDIMMPTIRDVLGTVQERTGIQLAKYRASDKEYHFINGSQWNLRHLDKAENVQGRNLDDFYIDEGTVGIEYDVYKQLTARIRRSADGSGTVVTNPGLKNHWIYSNWFAEQQQGYQLHKWRTTDNIHLPAEYLADLMLMPELWRKQFIEGEWGVLEGAAFALEPGVHIRNDPPQGVPRYYLSFDWGYKDPFWCILFSVTDGCIHVHKEYYHVKRRSEVHLPYVQDMIKGYEITGMTADTADSDTRSEYKLIDWWQRALNLPFYKPDKSRWSGWMMLLKLMEERSNGRPRFTMDDSCQGTYDSLASMVWDEKGEDLAPGDDHGADACRYSTMAGLIGDRKPDKYRAPRAA